MLFSKSVIFPIFIFIGLFFRVIFQKCYFPKVLFSCASSQVTQCWKKNWLFIFLTYFPYPNSHVFEKRRDCYEWGQYFKIVSAIEVIYRKSRCNLLLQNFIWLENMVMLIIVFTRRENSDSFLY